MSGSNIVKGGKNDPPITPRPNVTPSPMRVSNGSSPTSDQIIRELLDETQDMVDKQYGGEWLTINKNVLRKKLDGLIFSRSAFHGQDTFLNKFMYCQKCGELIGHGHEEICKGGNKYSDTE